MSKHILFDTDGTLIARYDSAIHLNIPSGAHEVSAALFKKTISETDGIWKRDAQSGAIAKHPIPPPSASEIIASLTSTVQRHIDGVAQEHGYDNIYTAVTYADEPAVLRFQAEGSALRAWRSLVWARCNEVMVEVTNGERNIPSDEELIALLPKFTMPKA